jgi:hypothetical protein
MSDSRRLCFSCGSVFPLGGLAYQVHIQMAADFDGYIDADAMETPTESSEQIITAIAQRSAEELMEEVYRERRLLFCKRCAERAWAAVVEPQPRS